MKSSIPQSRHARRSAAARPLFFIIILVCAALVFAAGAGATMRAFFQDADIAVIKTGPDTAPADTDIIYTITVSTSGSDDITGATLQDNLPPETTFVSLSKPASWGCTTPSAGTNGAINCTNSLVPTGSNDVFTLTIHINPGSAPGTFITNVANVSSPIDANNENDQSTAVTQVPTNNADLSLTKSTSPSQVHANTDVTFTITVTNLGPNAATNASFTDSLPGGSPAGFTMTFVSFTQDSGPSWNCGSPGSTTTCSIASLAANTTSVFSFIGHIPAGSSSTYTNETTVTSDADPNSENNTGSTIVTSSSCFVDQIVTTNADSGAGSLRQALLDACDGSTIGFDMSQVVSPITLTTGELLINKNLTIQGSGANLLTVMRSATGGTPQFRIFDVISGKTFALSELTINNGNLVSDGGGVFNQGTTTLSACAITGNTANSSGGALVNDSGGTMTVKGCTITGNSSPEGGGIANGGTLTILNSTVSGNTGDGLSNSSAANITNTTLSANSIRGISNNGGATVNIGNTIVSNTPGGAADVTGTYNSLGNNLIGNQGSSIGFNMNGDQAGTSGSPINPRLAPLANNGGTTQTHALLAGSPALDAGSNTLANDAGLTNDQRGSAFSRIVDASDADATNTVDIGAFEAQISVEDITDHITNEDTQLQFVFNLGGSASSVTATSSNTTLVPNNVANIALSGSGSTRTLTINPLANQFGTSTITVTVNGSNSQSMSDTIVLTVVPMADTPSVTNATTNEDTQSTLGLVISRNPADGAEVTHFKITSIINGALFKNDGATPINNGDFITVTEGNAGLKFTPAANLFSPGTTFSFLIQGATSGDGNGLSSGFATATITVNPVADTPSVTNASTLVNTQTTNGLVISRNAVDGTEITNFKITNITGGTLFKNNGTTQINNNDFITFAEGNAGLKFTPALDSNANGSFQVQASTSNANGGLGGGLATATITVNCGPTLVLNSSDSGSGSLRATINTACAGSTLTFNPVLIGQTITLTSAELPISKSLTIQGPSGSLTVMRSTAGGTPQFRV
ncbi:MAG TPA: choice-of-anchor Q domain-containing protein, partial [Pyrinomonadaceae bacterium]